MAAALNSNLDHEELTRKILNFIQSSINVIGPDLVPLLAEVAAKVSGSLPYSRQIDIMRIGAFAIEQYKERAIPILQNSLANILQLAA